MKQLTITLALLAACSDEVVTEDISQAQSSPPWSIEDQQAAVDAREARRKAQRIPDLRQKTKPADWIAHAYHGLVLDKNLDEIKLDEATVATIQQSLFDTIYPATAEAAKKKYGADLKELYYQSLQGVELRIVRAATLHGLINAAEPTLRTRYEATIRLLRGGTTRLIERYRYQLSPHIIALLEHYRVRDWFLPPAPGAEYIAECRAREVPIPPNWPDSRWVRQGPLAFVFISTMRSAEVYTYRDPAVPGVCYALPRRNRTTGSVELLGFICQSDTTGSACFWDNKTPMDTPLTGVGLTLQIDQIGNGSTLTETCTDCHRGYNVFNIHPGSALDLGRSGVVMETMTTTTPWDTNPAMRYTPNGQAHWVNPAPLALPVVPTGERTCNGCHEIPSTGGSGPGTYCMNVLEDAARVTMPAHRATGEPTAGWPRLPGEMDGITNTRYTTHIRALSYCP